MGVVSHVVIFSAFCLFAGHVAICFAEEIPGHLQYLGSHRPAEGTIGIKDFWPDPATFYNNYIKPGKPLLFKGKAKGIPAFNLWTDEYLRNKYGDIKIDIEKGKKETRQGGMLRVPMSTFLNLYKEANIYMVYSLGSKMMEEFHLPKPLLCGGYTKILQDAVLWFSSGGTKSVLHSDDIDNINCLMDGTKRLIFIDKKYKDLVEKDGFREDGGYSSVDVEKVDMEKFPSFRNIPWSEVTMDKGDCLFIPTGWYHHVSSTGPRNLAINIWFTHLPKFNHTDCAVPGELPESLPLTKFKVASLNYDNEEVRGELTDLLRPFKDQEISKDEFLDATKEAQSDLQRDEWINIFDFIDGNNDSLLDWMELNSFDIDEFIKKFPNFQVNDEAKNSGENEKKHEEL
ncbi:jmjC domain-containing protein 5 [Lingula anatina]|uniref:JmjC domain-containing protein 5 n=1 Tax=Lingula anatina TaxID=7574 RepID=A0A1S3JNJ7_LINAN|nr:jmjC domain-containing protein 5 [Lingula anatina]|eukprot:XP_013411943.1 jmjC domain-containing protein 5 [Lingula anatina]